TPKLLGPLMLGIRAEFADGGVSVQTVRTYVAPPKFPPALSFKANDLPTLVLTMDGVAHAAMAHPIAIYPTPVGRIYLNSRFVTYLLAPGQPTSAIAVE